MLFRSAGEGLGGLGGSLPKDKGQIMGGPWRLQLGRGKARGSPSGARFVALLR